MPVEGFSPNTKASATTIRIPMPLTPDFVIPSKNTAKATIHHCVNDNWQDAKSSVYVKSIYANLMYY